MSTKIPTKILKGEAALSELMAKGMPDWEAKQVLQTARTYGLNNIPVNGGYSCMSVEYQDGHYTLGPMKLDVK